MKLEHAVKESNPAYFCNNITLITLTLTTTVHDHEQVVSTPTEAVQLRPSVLPSCGRPVVASQELLSSAVTSSTSDSACPLPLRLVASVCTEPSVRESDSHLAGFFSPDRVPESDPSHGPDYDPGLTVNYDPGIQFSISVSMPAVDSAPRFASNFVTAIGHISD
ncbi:hypothetical protein EVAR_273_1 [Eumeta japonica]|uniref:Uncharacterized protein n=1 Tax=Eumeta variegata TaxID=151549 RepID=A0A4C1SAC4_EUMVA|nr:hypothetical protein EVAR_273_1 [Eumeta japonica]